MDFSLNDEQKMLIETVRRFIAEECHPLEDEIESQGFLDKAKAQALHDKAKALGLYGMNMPAELGVADCPIWIAFCAKNNLVTPQTSSFDALLATCMNRFCIAKGNRSTGGSNLLWKG